MLCAVCLSVLSVTLVYCGHTDGWIKIKLGMEVGLGPAATICFMGPSLLPRNGWIKMPLGTEIGLGPCHTVLDRNPAPAPAQFSVHVCCGQTDGWIKMPLGTEVGLGPGDIVLDEDPCSTPNGKAHSSPTFRPMSILAKLSPISETA